MSAPWYRWEGAALSLRVRLKPRAAADRVEGVGEGCLRVAVRAPAVENRANEALRALLARELGVAPSAVSLLRGAHGRQKDLRVAAVGRRPDWLPGPPGAAES